MQNYDDVMKLSVASDTSVGQFIEMAQRACQVPRVGIRNIAARVTCIIVLLTSYRCDKIGRETYAMSCSSGSMRVTILVSSSVVVSSTSSTSCIRKFRSLNPFR